MANGSTATLVVVSIAKIDVFVTDDSFAIVDFGGNYHSCHFVLTLVNFWHNVSKPNVFWQVASYMVFLGGCVQCKIQVTCSNLTFTGVRIGKLLNIEMESSSTAITMSQINVKSVTTASSLIAIATNVPGSLVTNFSIFVVDVVMTASAIDYNTVVEMQHVANSQFFLRRLTLNLSFGPTPSSYSLCCLCVSQGDASHVMVEDVKGIMGCASGTLKAGGTFVGGGTSGFFNSTVNISDVHVTMLIGSSNVGGTLFFGGLTGSTVLFQRTSLHIECVDCLSFSFMAVGPTMSSITILDCETTARGQPGSRLINSYIGISTTPLGPGTSVTVRRVVFDIFLSCVSPSAYSGLFLVSAGAFVLVGNAQSSSINVDDVNVSLVIASSVLSQPGAFSTADLFQVGATASKLSIFLHKLNGTITTTTPASFITIGNTSESTVVITDSSFTAFSEMSTVWISIPIAVSVSITATRSTAVVAGGLEVAAVGGQTAVVANRGGSSKHANLAVEISACIVQMSIITARSGSKKTPTARLVSLLAPGLTIINAQFSFLNHSTFSMSCGAAAADCVAGVLAVGAASIRCDSMQLQILDSDLELLMAASLAGGGSTSLAAVVHVVSKSPGVASLQSTTIQLSRSRLLVQCGILSHFISTTLINSMVAVELSDIHFVACESNIVSDPDVFPTSSPNSNNNMLVMFSVVRDTLMVSSSFLSIAGCNVSFRISISSSNSMSNVEIDAMAMLYFAGSTSSGKSNFFDDGRFDESSSNVFFTNNRVWVCLDGGGIGLVVATTALNIASLVDSAGNGLSVTVSNCTFVSGVGSGELPPSSSGGCTALSATSATNAALFAVAQSGTPPLTSVQASPIVAVSCNTLGGNAAERTFPESFEVIILSYRCSSRTPAPTVTISPIAQLCPVPIIVDPQVVPVVVNMVDALRPGGATFQLSLLLGDGLPSTSGIGGDIEVPQDAFLTVGDLIEISVSISPTTHSGGGDVDLTVTVGVDQDTLETTSLSAILVLQCSAFACCGGSYSNVTIPIVFKGTFVPSSQNLRSASQAAALVVSFVGGIAHSASSSSNIALASMLLEINLCAVHGDEHLSVYDNPTGWKFGARHGAYFRGSIVGNLFICAAFAAGILVLAWTPLVLGGKALSRTSLENAAAVFHVPSIFAVPFAALVQPLMASGVALVLPFSTAGDVALGLAAIAFCISTVVLAAAVMAYRFKCIAVVIPDEALAELNPMLRLTMARTEWIVRNGCDPWFKKKYCELFCHYRRGFQLSMIAEFSSLLVFGLILGIRPQTLAGCRLAALAALLVSLANLVLVVKFKPMNAKSHQLYVTVMALMTFTCSLCATIGGGATVANVGDWIAIGQVWLSLVFIVLDFCFKMFKLRRFRRFKDFSAAKLADGSLDFSLRENLVAAEEDDDEDEKTVAGGGTSAAMLDDEKDMASQRRRIARVIHGVALSEQGSSLRQVAVDKIRRDSHDHQVEQTDFELRVARLKQHCYRDRSRRRAGSLLAGHQQALADLVGLICSRRHWEAMSSNHHTTNTAESKMKSFKPPALHVKFK